MSTFSKGAIRVGLVLLCVLTSESLRASEVGTTAGTFAVGSSGDATYAIPLVVPPGTSGMQPQLSLQYDSQSGDGYLGPGFSLGPISSISRCAATLDQDGVVGGVDFSVNDRFCLDGQRLMAVAGTYGYANTEYRTELESFTRIISYGGSAGSPSYFVTWTKAGLMVQYGNAPDAKVDMTPIGKSLNGSGIRGWPITRVDDTAGH